MKKKLTKHTLWLLLSLAILFYCYEFFLRISPSVMVGELMQYFQLDAFGISQLLAIFYIAYTLGQIPAGLILDRYSIRLTLAITSLICALGVYLFIATDNLILAWIGRFIVGFASSFAFVAVLKIGRVYLPAQYFTRIVGITVAIGTLAASYGDVFASYINSNNFTYIFRISMVLGLILFGLFIFFYLVFAEHPNERNTRIHQFSWQDIKHLIKNYQLWLNALVGGLFYLPTTVLADVWGDYFLHNEYHFTLPQSSYSITWLFIGWMIGSPIMGYIADRFQSRRSIITVNALLSALILIKMIYFPNTSLNFLSALMFLLGITSSAQLIVWRIFHQLAPMNLAATGIALTNMIIMFTCAIGQMLIGFILSHHQTSHNINLYTNIDYHHSLILLPIALIAAAILVRLLPKAKAIG